MLILYAIAISCAFKSSVSSCFHYTKVDITTPTLCKISGHSFFLAPHQNTHLAEDNTHMADENCVDVQSDDNEYSDDERGNDIGEKIKGRLASLLLRMHACNLACIQVCYTGNN